MPINSNLPKVDAAIEKDRAEERSMLRWIGGIFLVGLAAVIALFSMARLS